MNIVKRHISDNYFREITAKNMVVYHFTAGLMPGCEQWLNFQTKKVNVPYILCKDGTINEYFNPKYWAYHTGVGKCKNSIGLEIECWGNLSMVDGLFLPWTKKKNQAVSPERVLHTNLFHNFEWWEMLTHKQVIALADWTEFIIDEFPIESLITHAEINYRKLDFPPDYNQVYDVIKEYEKKIIDRNILPDSEDEILAGTEHKLSKPEIQARINWLIKNVGWSSKELKRLVKYRDTFLKQE